MDIIVFHALFYEINLLQGDTVPLSFGFAINFEMTSYNSFLETVRKYI